MLIVATWTWPRGARQLVEAGRHAAVLLEQADPALHGVALLVDLAVERWRPTTLGPALAPVGSLIVLDRDRAADVASAQVGPVALGAVGLVRQHPVRSGARPSRTAPRHPDALQDGHKLRAVTTPPGGDQPGGVGAGLQPEQDPGPGAVALPAAKQPVDGLPAPVAVGHVTPRRTDPGPPSNPVDELAFGPLRRAAWLLGRGQQRFKDRPLPVGQVKPPGRRYGGREVSEGWSAWSKYQLPETSLGFGQPDITTRSTTSSSHF
jgi:hypothetical protein